MNTSVHFFFSIFLFLFELVPLRFLDFIVFLITPTVAEMTFLPIHEIRVMRIWFKCVKTNSIVLHW